jgi:pimeloyl-ACP methyl ester carboxylesterase
MTAVFVHGVPETPSIWGPLIAELGLDDAIALQLPGFGCPMPDGFDPTMDGYAGWLAGELARVDGPIDLVTHDWGAFLADRVLAGRPANVRSWVTDGGDLSDDFQWHDMALLWQTPGDGEAFMETFVGGTLDERAALLVGSGVPPEVAADMAGPIDEVMAEAILVLYRSATGIGREWGPGLDEIAVPSLVLEASQDAFRSPGLARSLAARLGAELATLPDQGHWWMLGDPSGAAAAIADFWAGLPAEVAS